MFNVKINNSNNLIIVQLGEKYECKTNFSVLLILVAVVSAVSFVSSEPKFNTPDGFTADDSLKVENKTTDFLGVSAVMNKVVMVNGDKNITVDTFLPEKGIDLAPTGNSVMKNISGVEGLYTEKDGRYIFVYSSDNQFVQVDAPSAELLEQVVAK